MDDTFDIKIGKTNISSANHTQTKRNDGVNFIFGNKNNSNTDLEELYAEYEEAEANYNDALQSQQKQDTEAQNQINNSETQKGSLQSDITAKDSFIQDINSQIQSIGNPQEPNKSDYAVETTEGEGEEQKTTVSYPGYSEALAEYNNKMSQLEQLNNQLKQAENEKNKLENDLSKIDNNISNLNTQNTQTSSEVQQAQSKMDTASAKLENAKAAQSTFSLDETEKNEEEINLNEDIDNTSIKQLNEIAAKYTDRTDLSEEEYQQIIAIEQLSQNFDKLYGQYKEELDTEGWIDNAYNELKKVFGGITREMVQDEFDNYFKQTEALKNALNGKEDETKEAEYEELERKLTQDPANAQKYLTEYCGGDEKALDVVNNWLEKNTDRLNESINYMDPHTYEAVIEDGEICIKEMKDGEEYFSLTLNEAADNFNCVFNPLEIIKDNDEVKELAPSDFESAWKFYNGVEFDYNNIEKAIENGFEYTQINVGLSTAYQMEEKLQNKTPETAFEIFKEEYDGDEDNAIEAFNNYYASLLKEEKVSTEILNNKLTELKAQKNDKGEIEFLMKFESLNPDNKDSLYNFFDYKGDKEYYEFKYNPEEYLRTAMEDESQIGFGYTNDLTSVNNLFWQINSDVAQNDILQERFKNKFASDNGYSIEEAMTNYLESRSEAFGDNKLQDVLNEYIGDMDSYAQKLSTMMSLGGIGLSFVCPAFGYVAMAGVFADNAIDGVNMATNNKQGEDWQGLVKNTFKEASYMAIGMGINATAQSAHNALTRYLLSNGSSAKLAATAGTALEVGVDGALSIGFDVATTGELNLSGNSIGLLMDVVSGIRGYKAIQASRAAADSVADSAAKNADIDTMEFESSPSKNREIEWETRERTQQEMQIKEAQNAQDALIDVMKNPSGGKSAADSASVFLQDPDIAYNISRVPTPKDVGEFAARELEGSSFRIATAGYSNPPKGYEAATKEFLKALDSNLGSDVTSYVTSPTADAGSIDAITTEVAGTNKGRLFYTTAEDYVEYINPENFPETINKEVYGQTPKYVLPDASSYSQATAEASNAFIATGGRNATVSDYVNAIKQGNKAVILNNTDLDVPAWGTAKSRVENASDYITKQIEAVRAGQELPFPEVGEFTREFIEQNLDLISELTRFYSVDGTEVSILHAASDSANFLKTPSVDIQTSKLLEFGFTDGNIKSIIESGGYNKAMSALDKGIDMSYVKDIAKLGDADFITCLKLIDEGFSPITAKQLAKLDESSIARAMELHTKGIPDMSLADSAVLTGEQASRINSIAEKHPKVSNYYANELASLEETQYRNALRLIEQGDYSAPSAIEAVKANDFDLHTALANKPDSMLKEITPDIEKELTRQAEILYKEYSSNIGEISYDTEILFSDLTGENGKLTAREKGIDSALKKLMSKYEKGLLDIKVNSKTGKTITDICREALADAYGTRIQLESISPDMTKLVLDDKAIDYNEFVSVIQDCIQKGRLDDIPWEYRDVINSLKEMQTQGMVDAMVKEIYDGNFHLTELNNYGDDISSYFTTKQLQQIASAYKIKYGEELEIVTKLSDVDVADKKNISFDEKNRIASADDYYAHYKRKGSVKGSGYTSTQGNVEYTLANGAKGYGEIQVRGTEVNKFADAEHIPYDIRQGKITAKDTQYSDVYSLIKNMSDDSFKAYNNYLTETYEYLRLKELGIEIAEPKIGSDLTYSNGKAISQTELQKLTRENLLEIASRH